MTRRTPTQDLQLNRIAETESQHELARSVSCDDCSAPIGRPCITRQGRELRAEHGRRIRKAERMRDAGEVECSLCRRQLLSEEQRESTPMPPQSKWVWCPGCLQIATEIEEAREVEPRTAAQWDAHRKRLYRRQLDMGRDTAVARRQAGEQATGLFGPRPEEGQ